MPGLIGKKIGMTSIFSEEGNNIPCTILEVGPCTVTQIKNKEVDGYNAVQIGYEEQKDNRISKSLKGHFSKAKSPNLKKLPTDLENALEHLSSSEALLSAFGEKNITSYLKLKQNELKDFNNSETFSKKEPITTWEKVNTLDC